MTAEEEGKGWWWWYWLDDWCGREVRCGRQGDGCAGEVIERGEPIIGCRCLAVLASVSKGAVV